MFSLRSRSFLIVALSVLCLLVLCTGAWGQGRSDQAFERVREVQARHTEALMERPGVVGTAVGLNGAGDRALLILLDAPGQAGMPRAIDGVPVQPVVTGRFYALAKPSAPPGKPTKPPKDTTAPAPPAGLAAWALSSSEVYLNWTANLEPDVSRYNVYRSADVVLRAYTRIDSSVSHDYLDDGLAPSTVYYYVVTAVDTSGNESGPSGEVWAETPEDSMPAFWCMRPVPIGVSTGHPDITAGTIGCRVKDASGYVYALSNNHVYADENRAQMGDSVLQPGVYDGGLYPRDAIGTLTAFCPIVFSRRANNVIDAAIALSDLDTLGNATPDGGYGTPDSTTCLATLNLPVKKYGRTTGLTYGTVYATSGTVSVQYDAGIARFINQIIITPGTFSSGGDSGSLIVTQEDNQPVGLLFAGSSSYTIANPIDSVLGYFHVTVDDQ